MAKPIVSRSYDLQGREIEGEVVVRMAAVDWEELTRRKPDYTVFYEWVAENAPQIVELCPYKFPSAT